MERSMLPEKNILKTSYRSSKDHINASVVESRPMSIVKDGQFKSDPQDNEAIKKMSTSEVYSYVDVTLKPSRPNKNNFDTKRNNLTKHIEVNNDLYAIVDKTTKPISSTILNNYIDDNVPKDLNKDSMLMMDNGFLSRGKVLLGNINDTKKGTVSGKKLSDGMLSSLQVADVKPPLPTPYRSGKPSSDTQHGFNSFNRNSISTEDILGSCQLSKSKLPNICDEKNQGKKSEDLSSLKQPGSGGFQKTHRRMRSHEPLHKNFIEDLPESNKFCTLGRDFSKKLNTPDLMKKQASKDSDELLTSINRDYDFDRLPEGWQEVKDGSEIYYWHIWTGTIQYERPRVCMTPNSSARSDSALSNQDSSSNSSCNINNDFHSSSQLSPSSSPNQDTFENLAPTISFRVHSLGWIDVDPSNMGQNKIAETVNNCISILEEKRFDLWNTSETWAKGADIDLILEEEILKIYEPISKTVLHTQPISKMRIWGVGRTEAKDFAYIARDQITNKHRCHVFRCHGHISGRSITDALQMICRRVLEEKRQTKENSGLTAAKTSNLFKQPSKVPEVFNEKPYVEEKKRFTAKYVGHTEVLSSSGIDIVNKCVTKLTEGSKTSDWSSVLIEVTTSEIKTIDCIKQQTIMTHRVRFISFLGVAEDERFAAYILAVSNNQFACHVFFCAPHAGTLTKAIEQACKLRLEKMLQGKGYPCSKEPEINDQTLQQNSNLQLLSVKEKTKAITTSMFGVFSKFNKRDSKRKEEILSQPSANDNEYAVNYFGSYEVNVGTGIEAVHKAVNSLVDGEKMIGLLQVQSDCVTLSDSNYTPLSKRVFDISSISFCGMASDRKHFGIIISCGKGKYLCHVFEECRNYGSIVSAIQDIL